jgi:hypothetical protein
LVFVTKYRRNVLTKAAHETLRGIFAKVCQDFEAVLRAYPKTCYHEAIPTLTEKGIAHDSTLYRCRLASARCPLGASRAVAAS